MGEYSLSLNVTVQLQIGGEEIIHDLAPRWQELCEEIRSAPFQRPEWVAAHIHAFEPLSRVILLTASVGGRLTALLPMVRKKCFCAGVPVVKLAGIANSHSVWFDIPRLPGAIGEESTLAIWDSLRHTGGWHVLELPLFPQDGACAEVMAFASQDGCPTLTMLVQQSPVLRLRINCGGEQAEAVSGPSRHFRHELRRYARILTNQSRETLRVTRYTVPTPQLLQRFFDLEASGWKGHKGTAIRCQPETLAFYNEIARVGATHGYFRLHLLAAQGKIAAGAFSVATRDCFFPLKIAYNESLRRGGPGHLLFNAIVNECVKKQIPELFFGGTDEHYKALWTQETMPLLSGLVFSSDIRSRVAYHVRRNVYPPLGRLRRIIRERFAQRRRTSKCQSDSVAETKEGSFRALTYT
jgi:CelD/BcsL family acetyltransferase involved in cellulose biosynthesis